MPINFQQLRSIMKSSGIPVYRDEAPSTANYPYIIYEFVNEQHKRASNKVLYDMPLYQIAFITKGVESELKPLKDAFNKNGISYERFEAYPYDENDDTVIQFITYVRCIK
jgi:hypothetical protein